MKRALVVGSGSIARRHIGNMRRLWPDADVACVSSSGRPLAGHETDATKLFDEIRDAVDWRPEMVIIASPAPMHLQHASMFAESGAGILIEKPLADRYLNDDPLVASLAPYADRIDIAYPLRFLRSAQEFASLIEANTVGRVVTVLAEVGQYLPDWRPGTDYRKGVSARKDLGGGVLLELSHEFDYLRWFFGDFEVAYCHAGSTGVLDIDVEDRADVIMVGGNDIVANLHLDFLQRKPTRTCKVIGSDGTLVWDAIGNSVALYGHGKSELLFEDKAGDRNQMYLDLLARFWRVSRGDAAPLIGLEHARQTLRLVDQAKSIARITRDLRVHGEAD